MINLDCSSQLEKLTRAGFELASSGYLTVALPNELSSQLGTIYSLIHFKSTRDSRNNLTLYIFEDVQCSDSISESSSG